LAGGAIESYARRFGYGVVHDDTGHGVAEAFHSGLVIPHFDAAPHFPPGQGGLEAQKVAGSNPATQPKGRQSTSPCAADLAPCDPAHL
jgi:hypothetical protein